MKKKNLLQRSIIIAVVTLAGIYIVIGPRRRPHFSDCSPSGLKATLSDNIRLGLDLKGGSHLVMRVKTDEYLKRLTENDTVASQSAAKEQGFEIKEARSDTTGGVYRTVL